MRICRSEGKEGAQNPIRDWGGGTLGELGTEAPSRDGGLGGSTLGMQRDEWRDRPPHSPRVGAGRGLVGSAPGAPRPRTRPATDPAGAGSPPGRRGTSRGGGRSRSPPAPRRSGPGQPPRPPRLSLPGLSAACQGCAAASGSGRSGCCRCPWRAPSLERAGGEPGGTKAGTRQAGWGEGAARGVLED